MPTGEQRPDTPIGSNSVKNWAGIRCPAPDLRYRIRALLWKSARPAQGTASDFASGARAVWPIPAALTARFSVITSPAVAWWRNRLCLIISRSRSWLYCNPRLNLSFWLHWSFCRLGCCCGLFCTSCPAYSMRFVAPKISHNKFFYCD